MSTGERLPAGAHAPFLEDGAHLTRENLEEQEKKFETLLSELMDRAAEHEATIRVIGSLAFRIKCPDYRHIEYENGRYLTDIDLITYSGDIAGVQDMFEEMGWDENMNVLRLFGDKRRIFYHPELPLHSDVFLDKLRFCHEIDFRGRLELDSPTIPLVDLLLEKLQIVEINRKDLVDIAVLLSQHSVGETPGACDGIDGSRIASLCSGDWGWWRTATMNIAKAGAFAGDFLTDQAARTVRDRLDALALMIEQRPRSLRWKLRSILGERVKWYREVEEVERS
ncbi:MAG: hypothetical protein PVH52_00375 [bacterium]